MVPQTLGSTHSIYSADRAISGKRFEKSAIYSAFGENYLSFFVFFPEGDRM